MAHEVRGVIARGKGEPVELTTVVVPDPGPGEALVDVRACGVCHTDLHYRQGGINDDFPNQQPLVPRQIGWSGHLFAR